MNELADITLLVSDYLQCLSLPSKQINNIVSFYEAAKKASLTKLTTGTGHRPTFSLRTLCRALHIAAKNPCGSVHRSLYEAFSLSFLTELDRASHPVIEELIAKYIIGGKKAANLLKHSIPQPPVEFGLTVEVEGFWITTGSVEPVENEGYILTDQVRRNLKDLARIASLCNHPVLIQGDTSVGKTSLVTNHAKQTGNK
jgi:midasin